MSKQYSIAQARDNFAAIVHELEKEKCIELTRRGRPVAVLLSKHKYDLLQPNQSDFWQRYKKFAKEANLAELKIDPAEIFGELRDKAPGRQAQW